MKFQFEDIDEQSRKESKGFTVLEILVAVTIFSIVSVIIFSIFHAAIKSQRVGDRETKMLNHARFALDTIEKDITNVIYRDETSYNIIMSRMIAEMEEERYKAEQTGYWEDFNAKYVDEESSIGNPYELGRLIDLQFSGSENGKKDTLTFTVRQPYQIGDIYRPYGVSRVKYFLQDGWLIRSEDVIDTKERDAFGNVYSRPIPPSYSRLAEGVKVFDLKYTFWYDHQWYEKDGWVSGIRQTRNGKYLLGDYREDDDPRNRDTPEYNNTLEPGAPGWNEQLNDSRNEPLDRLPSLIRVKLVISDPTNEKRTAEFQRVIKVPPSEETYVPFDRLEEEERENEQYLRDEKYTPVYPGVWGLF